jgi:hypothetical protein
MRIPRRGEVAAYVAKQFDVPFGKEQRKIGRLKEGRREFESSNDLARVLVNRLHRLLRPGDKGSPADHVEARMADPLYRHFMDESFRSGDLEYVWRFGALFFIHHSELASRIPELKKGELSRPGLEFDIYLWHFLLPVLANNLVKCDRMGRLHPLDGSLDGEVLWMIPSPSIGDESCVTALSRALSWLRNQLGTGEAGLREFLCEGLDEDHGNSALARWRRGGAVPGNSKIDEWARYFEGDRDQFRAVFHVAAATTRIWRHLVKCYGFKRAAAVVTHLRCLVQALRRFNNPIDWASLGSVRGTDSERGCWAWIHSGDQFGGFSFGSNYGDLVAEMSCALLRGKSPIRALG